MSEQENNSPRQAAVNALISWAKTCWGYYSMRDAVANYLESCGANRPSIGGEETILAHRKIAANRRTKHGQSIEQCSNTMPCKEEEEDSQPTGD